MRNTLTYPAVRVFSVPQAQNHRVLLAPSLRCVKFDAEDMLFAVIMLVYLIGVAGCACWIWN